MFQYFIRLVLVLLYLSMNKMDGDYSAVVSYYYICDVSANP